MSLSNSKQPASFANPAMIVNRYLWHRMVEIDPNLAMTYMRNGLFEMPIYPVTDSSATQAIWDNKPYLLYSMSFSRPTSPFFPIKRGRVHYGLRANASQTFEWSNAMQHILDRQDESARDINEHNRRTTKSPVYFHDTRVFQVEDTTTRDFVNNPYLISSFVVQVDYHLIEKDATV